MKTPSWNERFLAGTRGRIVTLLRRASRTVNQLAESLELTDNAVRAHLATLERDGLVQQSGLRRGTRKPHQSYDLTPQAEQLFPKAYGPLLRQLLDVLGERLPPAEVDEMLREVGHRLAAGQSSAQGDLEARIQKALELLGALGGLAEREERDGKLLIQGYSCPLADAVQGHPEMCRMAETLLTEVVGVPVEERCKRGASPQCCFEIRANPASVG
ncbi:MAG: ArsR family transcriptional regulator [Armatimonadetes bacterium]|nr:ArsR family transcriptional regulator [Armatimonadota bacterium]